MNRFSHGSSIRLSCEGVVIKMSSNGSYHGSTFADVRDQVFSDPYPALPEYTITLGTFYKGLSNLILHASQRRVEEFSDLNPRFQKLIHPKGIALAGTWRITEESPWSGYFAQGSQGLIIVRCSVLLYKTRQGQNRGFGFAGKIFPTMDPNKRVKTGNFVTIDVLAGTKTKYYTDASLTNAPPLGFNLDLLSSFGVITAGTAAFIRADVRPFTRPIYPVAELGVPPGGAVESPKWMMVRAWPGSGRVDRVDFRDELRVENYANGTLRFNISAASGRLPSGERNWRYLGHIELTESIVSDSADHRLVFHHPRLQAASATREHPDVLSAGA
jgi:hypothetical protein